MRSRPSVHPDAGRRATATIASIALLVLLGASHHAGAAVGLTPIGPFIGDRAEPFDYSQNMAVESLPVFGGAGVLRKLDPDDGGSIKVEWSSTFLGKTVSAISSMMGGQLTIAEWVFDQPVSRFGGRFENNSGTPDATLEFYDVNDALIDTVVAAIPHTPPQTWPWHGWESTTPIRRIVITGNGVLNGFLWFEHMQMTFAPVPVPGDLDSDGSVGLKDLLLLLSIWGSCPLGAPCVGDLDGDGLIGFGDALVILGNWT